MTAAARSLLTEENGATTLPMRIYSQVRLGVSPQINAISTLLLALVALALGLAAFIAHGRAQRA